MRHYLDYANYSLTEYCIAAVVIALFCWGAYEIHWHLNYRWDYSETLQDNGVVTDMDYTPSRTYVTTVGKTTQTRYVPAQHDVYILGENLGKIHRNREKLYQTVRLDDEVIIEYVNRYKVRKDNPMQREFDSVRLRKIISPKGREVEL